MERCVRERETERERLRERERKGEREEREQSTQGYFEKGHQKPSCPSLKFLSAAKVNKSVLSVSMLNQEDLGI
jgi:hypothetical protein